MPSLSTVNTHVLNDSLPVADWNAAVNNLTYLTVAGSQLPMSATLAITNEYHVLAAGAVAVQNFSVVAPINGQQIRLMLLGNSQFQNFAGGTGNIRTISGKDVVYKALAIASFIYDSVQSVWRENGHSDDNDVMYMSTYSALNTPVAPGTNIAFYMPIQVRRGFVPTNLLYWVNAQGGNLDVGIYNSAKVKIWTSGSFACPATGARAAAIPNTIWLPPDQYYLALVPDNVTFTTVFQVAGTSFGTESIPVAVTAGSSFPLPVSFAASQAATTSLLTIGLV